MTISAAFSWHFSSVDRINRRMIESPSLPISS
jgi:hypothetical protein